ncbi:hypothetical protein TPY_2327 [Sulfobacillus acidophilus TPY]|nr:hypothetical protein TPY_2327 [Sulfobacillus acidophilus TPY]
MAPLTLTRRENHFQLLNAESGEFQMLKLRIFSAETVHFYLTIYRPAALSEKTQCHSCHPAHPAAVSIGRTAADAHGRGARGAGRSGGGRPRATRHARLTGRAGRAA